MPDLIAQGTAQEHRWRRTVAPGRRYVIGRDVDVWSVGWDSQVSRRHVEVTLDRGRLEVVVLATASNPLFVRGGARESVSIRVGEHFVIGETTFTLVDEQADASLDAPVPITEQVYSQVALQRVRFRNADQRIEVLGRLPEVIAGAGNDSEMFVRIVNVLLAGIPRCSSAAIVETQTNSGDGEIRILHWDRRRQMDGAFMPSDRLIRRAIKEGESVVHVWGEADSAGQFTHSADADWAFCTPVLGDQRHWAIYIAGDFSSAGFSSSGPEDLRDDLKFAELAASTIGRLCELRNKTRRLASLSQFISPVVLEAIAGRDPEEALAPQEADVAVLFCDLRGFSRRSEQAADDLHGLLRRVSGALGVMTRQILEQGGVVGDFHGDAAMGFWGWPLAQEDAANRACRAALAIRAEFEAAASDDSHPLVDFEIGIGVAHGRAVAGKIGTIDQVKVTVFGPVVNRAARLEGMTKILNAPILVDEAVAAQLRHQTNASDARIRRVAEVIPVGFDAPIEVSELLPPETEFPSLTQKDIQAYEAALKSLQDGDWQKAFTLLHQVPASDRVKDFLTVLIAQHNRTPPADWTGAIPLTSKR